jgi:predicted RNA binding protein with dsRBD fold (UPF0201 family)
MGMVSFPPKEEPLGSLLIQIQATDPDRVINWLAPVTENGVAVEEIDLFEGISDSASNGAMEEDV